MNVTTTHQWTIVYDASHRSYVEDKLSKNILTPSLETPKDIATKSGEIHVRDTVLAVLFLHLQLEVPIMQIFTPIDAIDICPWAKQEKYSKLNIRQNAYGTSVCRILNWFMAYLVTNTNWAIIGLLNYLR